STLCCPFCGGDLKTSGNEEIVDQPEYDVLECHCGRYPVVDGIPILKKHIIGRTGQTSNEVIKLIERGRRHESLLAVLLPPPPASVAEAPASVQAPKKWREQAEALLTGSVEKVTASDLFDFYFHHSTSEMPSV